VPPSSSTEAPALAPPPPAPAPAIRPPPRFLARVSMCSDVQPGTRAWRLNVCVAVRCGKLYLNALLKISKREGETSTLILRFRGLACISTRTRSLSRGFGGAKVMTTRGSKRRGGGSAGGGVGAGAAGAAGAGGSAAAVSLDGGGGGGPPEHMSPGYGAGYDAGFQAGLLAASQGRAPPPGSAQVPAAAEGGAGASAPEPARPPFLALLEDFPDLFQKEVLERLDRVDRTLLGRTGSKARAAVKLSGLPRVGGSAEEPRVGIAAFCQSPSTFVWAVVNGCPLECADICETLAEGGHLEVLRWAREQGCPWDEWTCARAAEGGHLEVLKWAREHHCPWTEDLEDDGPVDEGPVDCCALAARGGHLEVLKWLREHHCPWNELTCAQSAAGGHLDVLKWAREHGCRWEEDIEGSEERDCCLHAAEGGHLEVLKWLREHDCPWDAYTCARAAEGGHLEVLKWAREHDCPWNKATCELAAGNRHLKVLRWAIDHGCPGGERYAHLLR